MQVKDFTSNKHKTINPQEYKTTIFHHYSLPAFDNSKTVSDEYGSTILSNKFRRANAIRRRILYIPNTLEFDV